MTQKTNFRAPPLARRCQATMPRTWPTSFKAMVPTKMTQVRAAAPCMLQHRPTATAARRLRPLQLSP